MADIFQLSPRVQELKPKLERFMHEHIYPNEQALFDTAANQPDIWEPLVLMEELKEKARAQGLWNLFLPRQRIWRGSHKSRICDAGRDHRPLSLGAGNLQLQRARYREYGSLRAIRYV